MEFRQCFLGDGEVALKSVSHRRLLRQDSIENGLGIVGSGGVPERTMSNHKSVVYLRGIMSVSRTGYRNRADFKLVILAFTGIF